MKTASLYGGKNTISFDGRSHAYKWKERDLYVPGVTSILSRSSKEALIGWAAGMASDYFYSATSCDCTADEDAVTWTIRELKEIAKDAKKAYRKRTKEAADIGKLLHKFAECDLIGKDFDDRKLSKLSEQDLHSFYNGRQAFLSWRKAHSVEVIDVERIIFSERWLYSGTTDLHAWIDGVETVGDFKSSSGIYPEMALQIAAYRIALEEEYEVRIPQGMIIRFDKQSGEFSTRIFPRNDEHANAFIDLKLYHEKMQRIEKDW